jgi:cytochrome c-type biogenesis protein CcmH/NrfF
VRLLALAAAALVLAAPAIASEQHPTQEEVESEMICPACHEPLDQSSSPVAEQMKVYIRNHIALGWTKSRIEDGLIAQLGPSVIGVPRKHGFDLLAWVLPLGGIAIGAFVLAGGAWVWSRSREPGDGVSFPGSGLDPALERRVDEELARFEG